MKARIQVEGFDWDEGNRFKSEAKHGISTDEIELFFQQELWVLPDPHHSMTERRFLAIGISPAHHQKPIMVVFTFREKDKQNLVRPISARRMNEREEKKFEEAFRKDQK